MTSFRSFLVRCGLSIMSGAIYALAYPPLGWRWLVIPGIAGLLISLHRQQGTRARAIGFIHGITAYAIGLSWLYQIFGSLVIVLWCVLAVFTALFAEMQSRVAARGVNGWKFAAFTAVNWCGWEFIRSELFPLKFPWMSAGLAVGPNVMLPWIGVYGVGFAVVLAVAFLVTRMWKSTGIVLAVLMAAVFFCSRLPEPLPGGPGSVKMAGVQLEIVSLNHFLDATNALPADAKYVVWPEYAVPFDIRENKRDWALLQDLVSKRDITLTLGTQSRPGGGDEWRNIALTMDPTGVRGEHTKNHPVHLFDDGTPGTTALPVQTIHGPVGTPICFDCDYEDVVRKMTAAGAEMIVAPTMDAEKWTAREHDQHAELFRIRACENGRWLFVCATSGVTQIIDAHGHVHSRLPALEQGTISGIIKREKRMTFYTRYGWLTPWCLLAIAGTGWLFLLIPWGQKEAKP